MQGGDHDVTGLLRGRRLPGELISVDIRQFGNEVDSWSIAGCGPARWDTAGCQPTRDDHDTPAVGDIGDRRPSSFARIAPGADRSDSRAGERIEGVDQPLV